jgi:hypothetical protein
MLAGVGECEAASRDVRGLDVGGRAVLVQTNWDRHWGTDEYLSGRLAGRPRVE